MDALLQKKIDGFGTLPTLPAVAIEVLKLVQAPCTELHDLARVIEKDPALAGRILKTVNSSFYGRRQAVTTLNQALVVLGLQSVKTLVLVFSLLEGLASRKAADGFDYLRFWRHSFYTACAAKTLASRSKTAAPEELFLAGLLSGIGMLVLDAALGAQYDDVCRAAPSHAQQAEAEQQRLGTDHGEVGGHIADQWMLPPELSGPVRWHVAPEQAPPEFRAAARLINLAERCADVFVDSEPAPAISDVRLRLAEWLGREAADDQGAEPDAILAEVGQSTGEVAASFDLNIGPHAGYERILREGNEALVELTIQSHQHAARAQQQADDLAATAEQLRRQTMTDSLTYLASRSAFEQFLDQAMAAAVSSGTTLALVMIDLDRFKTVNDTHGHPAGDAVLRHVGKLLHQHVGDNHLAARYGGEELALVLPGADRGAAAQLAERIRRAVARSPINCNGSMLSVTASFGVAAYEPPSPLSQPQLLIRAADRALYFAKQSGRNCVKVLSLPLPRAA